MSDILLEALAAAIGAAFGAYAATSWRLGRAASDDLMRLPQPTRRSPLVYEASGDVIQATPIVTGGRTVVTNDGATLPALVVFRLYQGGDITSYTISREAVWQFVRRAPPLSRAGFVGSNESYSQLFKVAKMGGWIEPQGRAWTWTRDWRTLGMRVQALWDKYGARVI